MLRNDHSPDRLYQPDAQIEEDEINLLDLVLVLLKRKMLIIGIVFFAGFAAVNISLTKDNIYKSEATISPREEDKSVSAFSALGGLGGMVAGQMGLGGGGSLTKLEVILKSRELTDRVIRKYNLMSILFPEEERDPENPPPTLQDGWKIMMETLQVSADMEKSTIKVAYEHKVPFIAQSIVEYFLTELSEMLREEVLHDARENKKFLSQQLDITQDVLLRNQIYTMLAKEIEKETFANAQKYFSFHVVDSPIVPDLNKKVKPKRAIICILSVFVAFFVAVFLAFFLEFVERIQNNDSARYQMIVNGLKFWKRPPTRDDA